MNPFPDDSAAYLELTTTDGDRGFGCAFTVGRGNDVQLAAIDALRPLVMGLDADDLLANLGEVSQLLTGDAQLRWLGPHKGAIHMAAGAVMNALWDMRARREKKPLWRLLSDLPPAELVGLVDFRYLKDALTPDEAIEILDRMWPEREQRVDHLLRSGYPAYTTTPGWLGY